MSYDYCTHLGCVIFPGAGISTSAGIGDFRGKAGKWTERDRQKKHGKLHSLYFRDRGPLFSVGNQGAVPKERSLLISMIQL